MSAEYPNLKVRALLYGHTTIDSTWTEEDYLALAIAALDQGGASRRTQVRVAELVSFDAELGVAS